MIAPILSTLAPAEQTFLGIPEPVWHAILLAVALGVFAWILVRRLAMLRQAAPDPRWGHPGRRLARLLVVGFGQVRQPRYPVAGILHILIFFGFLVLSLRSLTLLGEGFRAGFSLPGLGGDVGHLYLSIKDWAALVVLVCCVVAALRRLLAQPARYHDRHAGRPHGHEAYVILGLIALLMVADAFYEGAAMAERSQTSAALPLASGASLLLAGAPTALLDTVHLAAFQVHNVALLFFLCYLPVSKHFHVLTALPNVWFSNLEPSGRIKPPRYGVEDLDELEHLGAGRLEDFTWKHILDSYTCTDCGRCSDQCPAYAAGTPLSPRMISIKTRDLAYEAYPVLGRTRPPDDRPALVGDVITEGEIWACTTCGACEETCPVLIEYIDKIVDLRRHLVEEGRVPATLQKALADTEKRGNPYGKMPRKRGDWVKTADGGDVGVRVLEKGEEADLLFFTDSCTAYDPRIQEIARAFARLLVAAGMDCGTLGRDEVDSGNEVRRMGEEGLFEVLRDKNLEALEARSFSRIVTTDPHALNALRYDYGLEAPVLHHAQILEELLVQGGLRTTSLGDDRVYVFHDPCYLGRHNGIYEAPRRVLDALPGLRTTEMKRSRNRSFCCGGGSLYLFYEGECETRMGEMRLQMAEDAGAQVIVTACPFCLINLEDAVKTTGRAERMEVIDLAELVARHLEDTPTA